MFIIRNIPEHKKIADIKHVTVTANSPAFIDSVNFRKYT